MKNEMNTKKMKLEQMNLRLAELEAERANIEKERQQLLTAADASSAPPTSSKGLLQRASLVTLCILAVAPLVITDINHNAMSNVQRSGQIDGLADSQADGQADSQAISSLEIGQVVRGERQLASDSKKPTRTGKDKKSSRRTKVATQEQWGPSLLQPEANPKKRYYRFDPLVQQQQENLLYLGFDIGEADGFKGSGTQRAIAEFRALYLPDTGNQLKDAELAALIENYANLARSDAALYGIDHGIVAAIRLSSVRTGVDFSYLMKLAATESNFEPQIKAPTSSATGLYQFTRDTWLNTVKRHGAKYGPVADYAEKIEYKVTRSGRQRPIMQDEATYEYLLELRKNPRLSAIMAAEMVLDNQHKLADSIGREPTETDLYLTHFLGVNAAITFLKSLQQSPDMYAENLFPAAARSNRDIFQPKTCAPRTIDEVYAHFGEKFRNKRYGDQEINSSLWLATN